MVSYSRVTEGPEERTFVRVLLLRGKVQGAIMIGETGECIFETLRCIVNSKSKSTKESVNGVYFIRMCTCRFRRDI